MKILSLLASVMVFLVMGSCSSNTESTQVTPEVIVEVNHKPDADMVQGFQKLLTVCFSCHSPNSTTKEKIAPTMVEIKTAYSLRTETEEDFVTMFSHYVENPTSEIAVLKSAKEAYGLMPKFEFTEKELNQIAMYVFRTPMEEPEWYENNFANEKQKYKADNSKMGYVELGKKFALSTKSVLGKNLKGAIKKNGTDNAISFCNERAIMLTDSMSEQLHAKIIRVSDQPRNADNYGSPSQLEYIANGKEDLANGRKIKPSVQEIDGQMIAYYPIVTNKMCLQCHGLPNEQIKPKTMSKLAELYPNDKAKGYDVNQLRGIWVVTMDKRD